jgi:hypothetical protein
MQIQKSTLEVFSPDFTLDTHLRAAKCVNQRNSST